MKIIHITPSYKPAYVYGGPVISVAKLCETLACQSLDIQVLTTRANGKTELKALDKTVIDGVKIQYFNRITKDPTHFSPSLLWNLYKIIKTAPPTLIHIHSWWNFVSIFSCLLARIKKIPVVVSARGMLTPYTLKSRNSFAKLLIHQLIGKYLIRYATLHATTAMEKEDILKIIQPKRIEIIPNLIYFQLEDIKKDLYQKNYESDKSFKLLFLSRVEEKKGLELLFLALADCQFPWSLTIAGTGEHRYQEKLKQLAINLDISQSINWLGYVEKEKKYKILASHHLLVLFSYNENFANIVLESLSVGTAVAISNKVGLATFVKEHKLGWIADLEPHSITTILTNAYQSPQIITNIRDGAPPLINLHFNEATILKQYLELYKNSN